MTQSKSVCESHLVQSCLEIAHVDLDGLDFRSETCTDENKTQSGLYIPLKLTQKLFLGFESLANYGQEITDIGSQSRDVRSGSMC